MKKILIQGTGLALLLGLMTGCQSAMNTASGRPEINIHQASVSDIQSTATSYFRRQGYIVARPDALGTVRPLKTTDMAFERPNWQPSNLLGIPSCSRILITINPESDGSKRLEGHAYTIGDAHTPFENVVTAPNQYTQLQADLENIQNRLEPTPGGRRIYLKKEKVYLKPVDK
jgi:hypothetical protein